MLLPDPNSAYVEAVAHDVARFLGLAREDNQETAWHAVRTVYGLMCGNLRMRMPAPMPDDLQAVLRSAGMRYALTLVRVLRSQPMDQTAPPEMPTFTGFMFPELVVLHRYRKRTA